MKFYDFDEIAQAGDCIQFATTVLGLTVNREGRCQAVWRGGDGYNVALKKDGWYDHKTKEGGGLLQLCALAKFSDNIQSAQNWLGDWLDLKTDVVMQPAPMVSARYDDLISQGFKEIKRYSYEDLDGNLVHFVSRFEHTDKPKEFMQGTPAGWGLRDTTPILYRIEDWIHEQKVCIVEGEKDADTLNDVLSIAATICCGGSGKWRPEYSSKFKGKEVYIIRDNDPSGYAHAVQVANELKGVAKRVCILCPSQLPKGDLTDWVNEEQGTQEVLLGMFENEPEWEVSLPPDIEYEVKHMIGKQAELWTGEVPDVVPDLVILPNGMGVFYRNELNEIHGEPGRGKTWVALAAVKQVLDEGGKVIFLDPESSSAKIIRRLRILGCDASQSNRFLHLNPSNMPEWTAVHAFCNMKFLADLVVIDGVASYMQQDGLNEDVAADCITFLKKRCNPLKNVAGVLLTDHVTKSNDRGRWSRGSGAKLGEYKGVVYELATSKDLSPKRGGYISLKISKDNEGGAGPIGKTATTLKFSPMVEKRTRVEFCVPEDFPDATTMTQMSKPDAKAYARKLLTDRAWKKSEWVQAVQRETGRTATNFIKEFTDYALAADGMITDTLMCGKSQPLLIGHRDQVSDLKQRLENEHEIRRQKQLTGIS